MRRVIGLDIAKRIFQLHSVDPKTGEIERLKLQRVDLADYFARLSPVNVSSFGTPDDQQRPVLSV